MMSWKRFHPRIPVESLCAEVADEKERFGFVVDLSPAGLRLEQPLLGRRDGHIVQLEFELPEVDEIVWAKGEVCFDRYRNAPGGPVRSTGVRLLAAASRHLRLLRDWVIATAEARRPVAGDGAFALAHASHWRG
jgi:hypothetical protein